ncbi:ABC-2 type transport system ATP-binding protein [Duganella sp. CF402]|uniref:ABC transporter ATP-binding protein n=1 Tax=unclassified Duganella TaxID=2636909 RepID=UPI0008C9562D|nr:MULTISPECIES: ABC transporter ATP-binding protein [unclassified Duganella]RZT10800.1 ABC-2 type transport system ATP-binding protein [Duganella sp. BK701]SEK95941.1 ABC-2 type transport system ATP-binding protein [Duganella sp. CF402]
MNHPALRIQQVTKRYGAASVLRGVDLELRAGECFGLVGVNGAGKTSLIKCLLDFCALDDGSIEIFGQPHHRPAARQPLGFLPERFTPPYYLTGADFIRYLLTLQGLTYQPQAVAAMLAALDLDPAALKREVRSYSKGMTQKLGLAACLLAPKPLYVLDEPMSGLDPKARALLKDQLRRLHQSGSTMFLTSHALADVDELCDRMAILHDGAIRFSGSPAECRAQYGAATLEQAFLTCIA